MPSSVGMAPVVHTSGPHMVALDATWLRIKLLWINLDNPAAATIIQDYEEQAEETQNKSEVQLNLNVMANEVVTQAEETQNKSAVELTRNVLAAEVATQAEETQN